MGTTKQEVLKGISVKFRKNEFTSILGKSGSGKTTLLNIIGGLDKYDSGDLIIEGTSTKNYKSRDWDTYRNHRVGFIFQSYNLIMHQTVYSNVEIALTLSGVSKFQRKKRVLEVIEKVGLKEHVNKKPSQLSGVHSKDDFVTAKRSTDQGILIKNNLKEFKKYVDSNEQIKNNSDAITYKYDFDLQVYTNDYEKVDANEYKLNSTDVLFKEIEL